jgi:DoxX-like family
MNQSKKTTWISYVMQGLVSAMMLMGAVMNLTKSEMAIKGAVEMGYSESVLPILGIIALLSVGLYLWPKTTFYGAILLTAWYGGAVATHVIKGDTLSTTIMPVLFSFASWLALWLRGYRFENKV